MFIVFLGSVSQEEQMRDIESELRAHFSSFGFPIITRVPSKEDGKNRLSLAEEWFNLMDMASLIIAVPKSDGSFGEGVSYELAYAKKNFQEKVMIYCG